MSSGHFVVNLTELVLNLTIFENLCRCQIYVWLYALEVNILQFLICVSLAHCSKFPYTVKFKVYASQQCVKKSIIVLLTWRTYKSARTFGSANSGVILFSYCSGSCGGGSAWTHSELTWLLPTYIRGCYWVQRLTIYVINFNVEFISKNHLHYQSSWESPLEIVRNLKQDLKQIIFKKTQKRPTMGCVLNCSQGIVCMSFGAWEHCVYICVYSFLFSF